MSITPGIGEGGATNSLTNQQKVKTSGGIIHNIFDTFGKKEIDSQTILRNIKSKVDNMSTFMSEMVSDEKKENILRDNKLLDVINNVSDKKSIEVLENYASYENTQTQVIIVERESEEPMEESEGSSTRQFMTSIRQKAEDWSEPLLWL